MDSEMYQQIVDNYLLPLIRHRNPEGHRFMQDNDPKHVSRSTKAWMEANNVNHWPAPPESPDLNRIENLWHQMKEHLRRHVKPSAKDEQVNGIADFWKSI